MKICTAESFSNKEVYRTPFIESRDVPLRDSKDALNVDWISVMVSGEDERQIYLNSFITNHPISEHSIGELVEVGRTILPGHFLRVICFSTLKQKHPHVAFSFYINDASFLEDVFFF